MKNHKYDVIVVGGGHAGIEAALAAARMGATTLLLVIKIETIGRMSCNPSIGGPAKGHLAREIDALGGEMARVTDLSGIQFRMLNRKKGPAVWAPRSQNDRDLYSIEMRLALENQDNLDIIESEVSEILLETINDSVQIRGVATAIGENYSAPKLILANGTFLNGLIHIGNKSYKAGRAGEPASVYLTKSLQDNGLEIGRFKTGTPPRIDLRTVDFSQVSEQPGDEPPQGFSYYRDIELKNLVSCYLTYTNEKTHEIIRNNLGKSALYGGKIDGIGPRYCPSIEDKIVRFADKLQHHIFIEPEGVRTNEAYVNGISNSLPPNVQEAIVHSITGLEKAKIIRYGYAIEYDYVIPGQIDLTMETKNIKGLYLAGQINGTSGYEEAAAQGLMAGINAVLSLDKKEAFVLARSNSYIGVLIDDLITKGTNEPYRMFTSRAEYRLSLRQDNADERLMPIGYKLGLVSAKIWDKYRQTMEIIEREMTYLSSNNTVGLTNKEKNNELPKVNLKEPTRLINILKLPDADIKTLEDFGYQIPVDMNEDIQNRICLTVKYEGYLKRQQVDINRFEQSESIILPKDIDYFSIQSISYEAREKLNRFKPVSIGQAARISGVNFSDISSLLVYLKKRTNEKTQ